ncbi:hypothetical protein JVU11DRAFT_10284 [Chiua virens]|nr:hypothetical protein JVU11DRAFT_10284 [Chiua virens]
MSVVKSGYSACIAYRLENDGCDMIASNGVSSNRDKLRVVADIEKIGPRTPLVSQTYPSRKKLLKCNGTRDC